MQLVYAQKVQESDKTSCLHDNACIFLLIPFPLLYDVSGSDIY